MVSPVAAAVVVGRAEPQAGGPLTKLQRRLGAPGPAVGFHAVSLLLAYPALLWVGRDMWFTRDDWPFVLRQVGGPRLRDVFAPFDIHWTTLTILLYRAISLAAGARSYLPYLAVCLALHIVVVHLLWRVMLRVGVRPWIASGAAALFLVLGAGSEGMLWAFSVSYGMPLALGLGNVLLTTSGTLTWRLVGAVWTLAVLGLMCSGVGLAMVVLPVVCVAVRHGLRRAVAVAAVPALVFAAWLALTHATVLNRPGAASDQTYSHVPGFVGTGLRSSMGALVGPTAVAVAGLIALAAWGAWRARRGRLPAAVLACACGAVANFTLTALGRVNGGDPTTSRYLYVGAALLLPAVALALSDAAGLRRRLQPLVAAAVLAMAGQSAFVLVASAADMAAQAQHSRLLILAAVSVPDDSEILPRSLPDPGLGFLLHEGDALRLRDQGDLQPLASLPSGVAAEVSRHVHVQVRPGTTALDGSTSPSLVEIHDAVVRADGDCTVATGVGGGPFAVRVAYANVGSLRAEGVTPVIMFLYLGGTVAAPDDQSLSVLLPPGAPQQVDDTLPGTSVILGFSAGTVRLCP
jgi:hypothetical protein